MENELLNLFYQRFDSFQVLWTIYSTVVLGIIATLVSFPKHLNSKTTRIILIIGFGAFSLANMGALLGVQEERINLLYEIKKHRNCSNMAVTKEPFDYTFNFFKKKASKIEGLQTITCDKTLQTKSLIRNFHLLQDFLLLFLIWILPKRLAHFQLFRSISNMEIRIRGSHLPNPVISWDQANRIWILEESVEVDISFPNEEEVYQLKIPEKFKFDLATIPRFLWTFIAPFELSIIAPLVHDYIYVQKGEFYIDDNGCIISNPSANKKYISRWACDRIFLSHMKLERVGKITRYLCYYGVRWFGGFFWKEKRNYSVE